MTVDPHGFPANRSTAVLVGTICATGTLLPTVLGLIIRAILATTGVSVVSLSEGAQWVFPLTVFFFLPFGLLALVAHYSLMRATPMPPSRYRARLYVFVGTFCGMTVSLAYLLGHILQSIRDVADAVAFWPLTVLGVLLWALGGSAVGTIIGWLAWRMARRHHGRAEASPDNRANEAPRR